MLKQRWQQFWTSLRGEHPIYETKAFNDHVTVGDLKRGMSCMRVYKNKDGTWSAMPNWMGKDKPYATNYDEFASIPAHMQEKLGVLLLQESGSEWLTGIGRRVDNDVFWLEDG